MILQYYKIYKESYEPIRANPSDAGLDVFYTPKPGSTKAIDLYPNTSILLGTGLKFGIPHGYMLEVKNRSSWASKKSLLVGACVIDAGWVIIVSTAPRLSANAHRCKLFISFLPDGIPPLSSMDIIPLNPSICFEAIEKPGSEGRPG